MSSPTTATLPGPDQLFVIACPVCRGHVAATGSLCGRNACCPLCANLFQVPFPAPPPAAVESASATGPGLAEDWGGVIEQLTPPTRNVTAPPTAGEHPPTEFTLPTEPVAEALLPPEPATTAASAALAGDAPPTAVQPPTADGPAAAAMEPAKSEVGSEASPFTLPEQPAPVVTLVLDGAPPASAPVDPAALPHTEPAALDPNASELAFREPVRTIRQGGEVIEIRRLTPEERRVRRFRRNLMMIVVGVSILMVIVLIFLPRQK